VAIIARGFPGASPVAGQLPLDKLSPGHVLVEGADEEIAVVIGVRAIIIPFVAMRFSEAGDVHPASGPAFAVLGLREQFVDEFGPGIGIRIVDKASISAGVGGSPSKSNDGRGESECDDRRLRWSESGGSLSIPNEVVDWVATPLGIGSNGNRSCLQWLETTRIADPRPSPSVQRQPCGGDCQEEHRRGLRGRSRFGRG
jgi:hypothetical protein